MNILTLTCSKASFIFLAGYYAQFLSGLNTGHLYHPTQVF